MRSELESRPIPNRILNGLELSHSPECYLAALDAVLRYNGDVDGILVNYQLGFCYWPSPRKEEPAVIAAFEKGEPERMIAAVSGIDIRWSTDTIWERLLAAVAVSLNHGQPLMVLVDTFFLTQFSKRKGHLPHAVLIYGYDSAKDRFCLKSAVPYDWEMRVDDFRPACQSRSIAGGLPITWIEFGFPPQKKQLIAVSDLLQHAVTNMTKTSPSASSMTGIMGMKQFAQDFAKDSDMAPAKFESVCRALGQMTPSIFHQRRRFVMFLTKVLGESDDLCRRYSHLATQWEIFANACLKLGFVDTPNLRQRITDRLKALVYEEERALQLVEEKSRLVKTVCVQGA